MPKAELARDKTPSARIQKVIDQLREGVPPTDPAQAVWDDDTSTQPSFAYYNYHEHRHEWGRGRIPKDLLWMYMDPEHEDVETERRKHDGTAHGPLDR